MAAQPRSIRAAFDEGVTHASEPDAALTTSSMPTGHVSRLSERWVDTSCACAMPVAATVMVAASATAVTRAAPRRAFMLRARGGHYLITPHGRRDFLAACRTTVRRPCGLRICTRTVVYRVLHCHTFGPSPSTGRPPVRAR